MIEFKFNFYYYSLKFGCIFDIIQFDAVITNQLPCDEPNRILFITDGPVAIRQVIVPEAANKEVLLPSYFWRFCDIRKEYRRLYNNNENFASLSDILKCKQTYFGKFLLL